MEIYLPQTKQQDRDTSNAFDDMHFYSYTPLSRKIPQIRLLTLFPGGPHDVLTGTLSAVTLEGREQGGSHASSWEALSYCWGDPTGLKNQQILISGRILHITGSLHLALQNLRLRHCQRVIWIDQVCINQNDLEERGQQVKHMNLIYGKAANVTAWLGSGKPESHRYMEMLSVTENLIQRNLYPHMKKPTLEQELVLFEALQLESSFRTNPDFITLDNHDARRRYLALLCEAFCRNEWFERLWVVQEAVLPAQLVLQYGRVVVDWNTHSKACLELLWADLSVGSKFSVSGVGLTDNIQMLREVGYGSSSRSLIVLLNALKRQKTSDARDRVYGLLGIAEPSSSETWDEPMVVDYKIGVDQLAEQLMFHCLHRDQTLDVLSTCCAGNLGRSSALPSWAIDLRLGGLYCDQLFGMELRTWDNFSAGMHRPIQYQYMSSTKLLSLFGVEIDIIAQVSKKSHCSEQYGAPRGEVWSEWKAIALATQDADPYNDIVGRREAFWRSMIINQIWDDLRSEYIKAPAGVEVEFERWLKREDLPSTFEARKAASIAGDQFFYNFVGNLAVGNGAHLFRTRRGYLGLACKHVAIGDKIVILWGSHLPSVLREAKPGPEHETAAITETEVLRFEQLPDPIKSTYTLVGGQVYVHGLMDGEVASAAQEPQEFRIH